MTASGARGAPEAGVQVLMAAGQCSLGIDPGDYGRNIWNMKKLFSDNHQIVLTGNIKDIHHLKRRGLLWSQL